MCCCAYSPSYPERISCLFIEIILGLKLHELLQLQLIFSCLSLSCLWSFRDQNCWSLKMWLFKKNAATLCGCCRRSFISWGYPCNGATSSLLQHNSVMWVLLYAAQMQGTELHQCSSLMQRKSSLPLQVIVPQRKGCCKARVLCWSLFLRLSIKRGTTSTADKISVFFLSHQQASLWWQ